MKQIRIVAVALVLAVAAISFSSCTTTGNPSADVQSYWNSPAVQQELQNIQSMAVQFVNSWLSSNLKVAHSANARESATDQITAKIKAKHPTAPDSVIRNAVAAELAKHVE